MQMIIERNVPIPSTKKIRSPEMSKVKEMRVGDSVKVPTLEHAHRIRVYISRQFGKGAGLYRREESGSYRVWRTQ